MIAAVRVTLDTIAPRITWRRPSMAPTPGETLVVRYSINEGEILTVTYTIGGNTYAGTVFGDRVEVDIPGSESSGEGTLTADVVDALGNTAEQSLFIEDQVCPEPEPPPGFPPGSDGGSIPGGNPGSGGGAKPPPGTPPTPSLPVPLARARTLYGRWRSRRHIGTAKPTQRVFVRRGGFRAAAGDDYGNISAICPAVPEAVRRPWQYYWQPSTPYLELPTVSDVSLDQNFEQNGICNSTINVENVVLDPTMGDLGLYHKRSRGHLSPLRGYDPRGLPRAGVANEWAKMLERSWQVSIVQGYGDTVIPTYTGLIDDVDSESAPDRLTITARDFGGNLADRHIFGDNIGSIYMKEPLTFADRSWYDKQNLTGKTRYILVDDAADVVKWLLRIAGFKEWEVENTGQKLKDKVVYNRSNTMMDVIKKMTEMTNYVFFMMPPSGIEQTGDASDLGESDVTDTNSIGVPCFRWNRSLATVRRPIRLRDKDLLMELQAKQSQEPIAMNIRVRGKQASKTQGGRLLGAEGIRRYMDFYPNPIARPSANPVSKSTGLDNKDRGPNKHFVSHDELLVSTYLCQVATRLVGFAEALKSITATTQTAGYPFLGLDQHVVVFDTASGYSSRLWVTNLQTTFRSGNRAEYKTTIGGSLIDTPDVRVMRQEVFDILGKGADPGPSLVGGGAESSS